MASRYLTTGAAAEALGVAERTLQHWAQAGLVTPALVTPGGHYRWSLDELRDQLAPPAPIGAAPGEPEPQPVAAAVVTSARGILAVRRNDGVPPWSLVAGEVEPGETAPFAAVREVKEETGLEVRPGHEIGRRIHPATGRLMIYVAARLVRPADTDVFVGDRAELAEVRWIATLAEADALLPGLFPPVRAYLARALRRAS